MPSATTSAAITTDAPSLAIIPTVSGLKEDTNEVLESETPPTVTELTSDTEVAEAIKPPVEVKDDAKVEINVAVQPAPVNAEPIIEIHGVESVKPTAPEDQILFNAAVKSIPLDYEKMMQIILFCADVFLLGIIIFLSIR